MQSSTTLTAFLPPLVGLFCMASSQGEGSGAREIPLSIPAAPAIFPPVPVPPSKLPPGHAERSGSDAELLGRVAAQDEAAFAQLYRNFSPGLYTMVYEIVGQTEAEDVLQEAFVQMWKRAATFDAARSSAFTWAVMIARHKAIDRLRARQRRERGTENFTVETEITAPQLDADTGSVAAAQGDERARLLVALGQIPTEQREAIHLAFFGGLTHAAISDQLETPLGTIKARIRRGLQALQGLLQST